MNQVNSRLRSLEASCTELYGLGRRQRSLYAGQRGCKWVKTVEKTVPLQYPLRNIQ